MSKLADCPFCEDGGEPACHFNKHSVLSFVIKCFKCGARGPHAKVAPDAFLKKSYEDAVIPAKQEAAKLWNKRQDLPCS